MSRVVGPVDRIGDVFIPCTREISIGRGVVYRPIRAWHSGVLAGEGITSVRGDGSGCLKLHPTERDYYVAPQPHTVTHRFYWNVRDPERVVSAFLSYPKGMGCLDEYFWEAMLGGPERWTGPHAEETMEAAILDSVGDPSPDAASKEWAVSG